MYIYIEEVVSIMLIANRHTQSYPIIPYPIKPPPKKEKSQRRSYSTLTSSLPPFYIRPHCVSIPFLPYIYIYEIHFLSSRPGLSVPGEVMELVVLGLVVY